MLLFNPDIVFFLGCTLPAADGAVDLTGVVFFFVTADFVLTGDFFMSLF